MSVHIICVHIICVHIICIHTSCTHNLCTHSLCTYNMCAYQSVFKYVVCICNVSVHTVHTSSWSQSQSANLYHSRSSSHPFTIHRIYNNSSALGNIYSNSSALGNIYSNGSFTAFLLLYISVGDIGYVHIDIHILEHAHRHNIHIYTHIYRYAH
eukprot:GHVQ01021347.1.p1 GENE.GHVQ01021347.1~~GHVQ01021347.1.p1  ORF type:complete len:154 (+),score=10.25 GHVQ01021347.1:327-788(+)